MATKKKDGGAERADTRRKVVNKRIEQKYGLEGFTKQADVNLKNKKILPTNKEMGAVIAGSVATEVAGKLINKLAQRVGSEAGSRVATSFLDDAVRAIDKSSQGGRVFRTNTPMGPSLGSTKIMTPNQLEAAKGGLSKIASNRASEIASNTQREIANIVAGAVRATSKGVNLFNAKYQTKPKARKNTR